MIQYDPLYKQWLIVTLWDLSVWSVMKVGLLLSMYWWINDTKVWCIALFDINCTFQGSVRSEGYGTSEGNEHTLQSFVVNHYSTLFELNWTNSISIEYASRINWAILSLIRALEILGVCLAHVDPAPHPHHRLDTWPGRAQVADSGPIFYPNFTQIGSGLILYQTRLQSLPM